MGDLALIHCRAKVAPNCQDCMPWPTEVAPDQSEDGTYQPGPDPKDVEQGTVVCDACYVFIMPWTPSGAGRHDELPQAIDQVRAAQRFIGGASDEQLGEEIAKAEEFASKHPPYSPSATSARASVAMIKAEVERRAAQ